jgi:hypothetical protein
VCRERDEATPEDRRHVQEIKNFYYGAKTDLASLPGDEEAFLKLTGPSLQMPLFRCGPGSVFRSGANPDLDIFATIVGNFYMEKK